MAGPPGEERTAGACWRKSPCLGLCEWGSAALVRRSGAEADQVDVAVAPVTAELVAGLLRGDPPPPPEAATAPLPQAGEPGLRLLRRAEGGSATLPGYRAAGGLGTLRRALELGPEAVLGEVAASRLLGRGGAAFPASRKWEAVARSPVQPHYVVCNADESEPGTFKDRVLLERDPFGVLEGLLLAGFATGSARGYVYLRDEYPLARARLAEAIAALARRRLAGTVGGRQRLRLRGGAAAGGGAYICGEETALFNSIEGRRGEPRNKPPFPVDSGLFGRPTLVNNVETLLAVLEAVGNRGSRVRPARDRRIGGHQALLPLRRGGAPGLYEVEFGATLGELIELAGGVPARPSAARRPPRWRGRVAGRTRPARRPADLRGDPCRRADDRLGSDRGHRRDRRHRGHRAPDRPVLPGGVVRPVRALPGRHRPPGGGAPQALTGRPAGSREDELRLLGEVAQVMRDASICGLGQTAANAVQSALAELEGLA